MLLHTLADTVGAPLQSPPINIKQAVIAIRSIITELHEHAHTVHDIKDQVLAQNRVFHVLALKKLVENESIY